MKLDLNIAAIWGAMTVTATALMWMFATFASAAEVNEIKLDIAYGQYYDRLEDYNDAVDDGQEELADEFNKQMERLKAKICKEDPEWERCDNE